MKLTVSLLVALLLALTLTGCAESSTEREEEPIMATMLQGSPSGVWFMLSNGLSECVNTSFPGSVLNITPGGVVPNVIRLCEGESDFALTHNYVAVAGSKGEYPFDQAYENIVSVASFYPSAGQLFLRSSLGVKTMDEIIENKVKLNIAIGTKGELVEASFLQLIEAYGVTREEMEAWGCTFVSGGHSDVGPLFADGVIDGYFVMVSTPSPVVMENATNNDMVLVELSPDKVRSICETYGYSQITINKDTYTFMTKDVEAFANYTMLAAITSTDEETVYKMAKSIHENLDYLQLAHAALSGVTEETLIQHLGVPLHPGAERYYKEAGLL